MEICLFNQLKNNADQYYYIQLHAGIFIIDKNRGTMFAFTELANYINMYLIFRDDDNDMQ